MNLRNFLLFTLGAITLGLLWYGFENWRSANEWNQTLEQLRGKNEPVLLEEIRPDSPDAAPARLQELVGDDEEVTRHFEELTGFAVALSPTPAGWNRAFQEALKKIGVPSSLEDAPAIYLRETDALAATMEPYLAVLPADARGWPVDYSGGFETALPHVSRLIGMAGLIQARAIASLQTGDVEAAGLAMDQLLCIGRSLQGPATLVELLVAYAVLQKGLLLLNLGMQQEAWTPQQLRETHQVLADTRPLQMLADALRGERVLFLYSTEEVSVRELTVAMDAMSDDPQPSPLAFLYDLRPAGWTQSDRARFAATLQRWIERAEAAGQRPFDLRTVDAQPAGAFGQFKDPLTASTLPAVAAVFPRAARVANDVRLAAASCLIEAARLEGAALPADADALEALLGSELPREVLLAAPVLYEKTGDQAYLLYGRGLDGVDDGGSPEGRGPHARDWVWAVEMAPSEE